MGTEGELCKVFDVKDGYGIHDILPQYGIVPVIITGRTSKIVENRAVELGIVEIYQGVKDKAVLMKQLMDKYGCPINSIAYIGDDLLDLPCMQIVIESGGVVGCPADAVRRVREIASYVCQRGGGDGAVREFIAWLLKECSE